MDNLCKQYVKNIKTFFPHISKKEKDYLKNLERNICDYCEDNSVTSIEKLYKDFGTPSEVVNSYYSSVNIDYILKQIKKTKIIKTTLIAMIVSALVAASAYCTLVYSAYQIFEAEQIFSEDTSID